MDFESYARASMRPLLRFAVLLTSDVELAQDLVQEVLVRACARWPRIKSSGNPHAYVRRMLVNESVSWHRKWGRVRPVSVDELDRAETPATVIEERDQLLRHISSLPPKQRAAIVLRYFEDLSDAEIADALHCRPVTVRGYVHRGLAALRVDLDQTAHEERVRS